MLHRWINEVTSGALLPSEPPSRTSSRTPGPRGEPVNRSGGSPCPLQQCRSLHISAREGALAATPAAGDLLLVRVGALLILAAVRLWAGPTT